jgi:hypothetical protein
MNNLRYISLPAGGLLAWSDKDWLRYILPADSWKKRVILCLSRLPFFEVLVRRFDGKLKLDGWEFDLSAVTSLLAIPLPLTRVAAVFANSRRMPPRIYVWLSSDDQEYFLKIGTERDYPAFQNEFDLVRQLDLQEEITVMLPLDLRRFERVVLLLSEGLPRDVLSRKKRIGPQEIIARLTAGGVHAEGFFGGPVHGDLSSNNVFVVGHRLVIVDWEFAAPRGPDYCDLVELAAARIAAGPKSECSISAIGGLLCRETGCHLAGRIVAKCLAFLTSRGNKNAERVLAAAAFRAET